MIKKFIMLAACASMALSATAYAAGKSDQPYAKEAQPQQSAAQALSVGRTLDAAKVEYAKATQPSASAAERALAFWELVAVVLFGGGGVGLAMATLAVNSPRAFEIGTRNQLPVIAADIIYEGAAVGMVVGTGHCRPLAAGDKFAGFAEAQADNSAGAAAAINVDLIKSGQIQLSVSGAVITDVGQPVYATDDDTFVFLPTGAVFIGFVKRFVSAGVVVVDFDAGSYKDPYGERSVRETLAGIKTFDAEDSGKVFFVTAAGDGAALTLPAIATGLDGIKVVAIDAFGTTQVKLDPAAADMILGPDITGADNKDLLLTKATQRRGDYVVLGGNDADGYSVQEMVGIWAREA